MFWNTFVYPMKNSVPWEKMSDHEITHLEFLNNMSGRTREVSKDEGPKREAQAGQIPH